jgi:hypothetical protein
MVLINMVEAHAITSMPMNQLAVQLTHISSIIINHISKYPTTGLVIQPEESNPHIHSILLLNL